MNDNPVNAQAIVNIELHRSGALSSLEPEQPALRTVPTSQYYTLHIDTY